MNNKLRQYFPMIRTREEVLKEIKNNPGLLEIFKSWKQVNQEEFLDFCTGVKGVKMTYDSFFKEIMNPEYTPERLCHSANYLEAFSSVCLETNSGSNSVMGILNCCCPAK